MRDAFDTFWLAYPHRIAKGAARAAFEKALRKTTLDVILKALESYKRHKPEDRPWCHASTWLNQERWEDEWEPPATIVPKPSECLMRKVRDLDELKASLIAQHGSIPPNLALELNRARSLADVSDFLRNRLVPNIPANVTPIRKVAT